MQVLQHHGNGRGMFETLLVRAASLEIGSW
jgi:hypothetical protein